MKNVVLILAACFFTCLTIGGAFAQKGTPVMVDGQTLYRKSCEKISANTNGCVLCEDKKMTKNCKEYSCDSEGNCIDFGISIADLKKIARDGSAAKISGFQRKNLENTRETLDYIEGDNSITFVYKEGNNLILERYKAPSHSTSSGNTNNAIFKETKPTPPPKKPTINDIANEIACDKMKTACDLAQKTRQLL